MLLAKTLIIAPVLALIALTAPAAAGSTPRGVRPANASAFGTGWLHEPLERGGSEVGPVEPIASEGKGTAVTSGARRDGPSPRTTSLHPAQSARQTRSSLP